jgi:hypothetical protein
MISNERLEHLQLSEHDALIDIAIGLYKRDAIYKFRTRRIPLSRISSISWWIKFPASRKSHLKPLGFPATLRFAC